MKHDADRRRTEHVRSLDQHQARQDRQAHQDPGFYQRLGLETPALEAMEATFMISIYCEHWTPEDRERGRFSEGITVIERETVDADALRHIAQDHGMDSPSASDPRHQPYLWFSSSTPREDREYFEQGVHKYYSLHVHQADNHRPEPADWQRIADLIGVRFDHPLQLHPPAHEQEGPDLSL